MTLFSSGWRAAIGLSATLLAWVAAAAPLSLQQLAQQLAPQPADTAALAMPLADQDAFNLLGPGQIPPTTGVTVFVSNQAYDGRQRRVVYLRPTVMKPFSRAPAFVLLHYHHGSPERMEALTRAARLVSLYGAWVVLPEAYGQGWNFNPARPEKTDDSGFLARVIDNTLAAFPIDPQRVYMGGFSQGAFMTQRFLCEHSERIAAAVFSSATLLDSLREVCQPTHAVPVMSFHGTADPRVYYKGSVGLASAPETAAFYAARNGCAATPQRSHLPDTVQDGTTVDLDSFQSCSSGKPVKFYSVNGGGHTWPGNDYQGPLLGRTTQDIDATLLMYSFAMQFKR